MEHLGHLGIPVSYGWSHRLAEQHKRGGPGNPNTSGRNSCIPGTCSSCRNSLCYSNWLFLMDHCLDIDYNTTMNRCIALWLANIHVLTHLKWARRLLESLHAAGWMWHTQPAANKGSGRQAQILGVLWHTVPPQSDRICTWPAFGKTNLSFIILYYITNTYYLDANRVDSTIFR